MHPSGDSTVALSCHDPALPLSPRETELQVCVAWCNHSSSLSILPPILSVSVAFPLLFICSTNQRLCLKGNQAVLANYAALAVLPPSLSLFYLTSLPITSSTLLSSVSLFILETSSALHHSLRIRLFAEPPLIASAMGTLISLATIRKRQKPYTCK